MTPQSSQSLNRTGQSSQSENRTNRTGQSSQTGNRPGQSSQAVNRTGQSSQSGNRTGQSSQSVNRTGQSSQVVNNLQPGNRTGQSSQSGNRTAQNSQAVNRTGQSTQTGNRTGQSSQNVNRTGQSSQSGNRPGQSSQAVNRTGQSLQSVNRGGQTSHQTGQRSQSAKYVGQSSQSSKPVQMSRNVNPHIAVSSAYNRAPSSQNNTHQSSVAGFQARSQQGQTMPRSVQGQMPSRPNQGQTLPLRSHLSRRAVEETLSGSRSANSLANRTGGVQNQQQINNEGVNTREIQLDVLENTTGHRRHDDNNSRSSLSVLNTQDLPDILNSHMLPPYSANSTLRQHNNQSNNSSQQRGVQGSSINRSRTSSGVTTLEGDDKDCCSKDCCLSCVTVVTTFRWVLVSLALIGVLCVVTGIILGTLHILWGGKYLLLSLLFIGKFKSVCHSFYFFTSN